MKKILTFFRNEAVLCLSALLALISMVWVPPSAAYLGYIDLRTLALLFCFMTVMAGLDGLGVFLLLAGRLLRRTETLRGLALALVALCFFSSMVITNDVALLTFVPFTLLTCALTGQRQALVLLVTLETIAANLGSMLTPIGNPQNLYLFSRFGLSLGDFLLTLFPYAALSLLLLVLSCRLFPAEGLELPSGNGETPSIDRRVALYAALFVLSLLTVFRVLPYPLTAVLTLAVVALMDRNTLKHVDFSLLLTFTFLFVFIGNLQALPAVSTLLRGMVQGREVLAGVLASQVLSNVPAALLLSGFTTSPLDLLVGVNLGGLGTLIASMASLISYKFLVRDGVAPGRYLLIFTLFNLGFLAALLALWLVL